MHKGDDPTSITSCFSSETEEKHGSYFSKNPGEKQEGTGESEGGGDSGGNTSGGQCGIRSTKSGDEQGKRCGVNIGDAICDLIGDNVASGTTNAERNSSSLSIARLISQSKSVTPRCLHCSEVVARWIHVSE